MSTRLQIQRTYFELVGKHLSGSLEPVWAQFERAISQDPHTYDPLDWSRFLTSSSTLLVPTNDGRWTTSARKNVMAFVAEVDSFWQSATLDLMSELKNTEGYCFHVRYSKLHKTQLITCARTYFDTIYLEDPISLLAPTFELREARFLESAATSTLSVDSQYRSLVDEGLDLQISSVLFSLWWLLRYRDLCCTATDPAEALVVPRLPYSGPTLFPAVESELASKTALRFISELTGNEFQNKEEIVPLSERKRIPWLKIATENELLNSLFRTSGNRASEASVIETVREHSTSIGMPDFFDEFTEMGMRDGLLGRGIYNWVEFQSAEHLDHLWQATVAGADAAVLPYEWMFQKWLLQIDSTKAVPPPPLSQSQIAALTIQSEHLLFLENLTETEIAFIRRADRLAEMRRLLSSDHATCRNSMSVAPEIAEAAATRFVETLASYKEELGNAVERISTNRVIRVVRTAKEESLELGLTTTVGVLGLIVAPPWSFLLTALGMVIGGQSIRGIASAVSRDIHYEETSEQVLRSSPLSVCLAAQNRTKTD